MRSLAENNRLPCSFEKPSGGFTDTKGRTDGNLWFRVKHDEKPPFEPEGTFPQGVFRDGLFDHHGVVARIPFPVVGKAQGGDEHLSGGGGNDRNLKFRLLALGKYPRQPKMETRIFNDVEPGSRVYKTLDLTVEEQRQAQLLKDIKAIRSAAEQGIAEAKIYAPPPPRVEEVAQPVVAAESFAEELPVLDSDGTETEDEYKHEEARGRSAEAEQEGTILKQSVLALADTMGVPLGDSESVLIAEASPIDHQNMVRLMEGSIDDPNYNRANHRSYVRNAILTSVIPPNDSSAWMRWNEDEAKALGQLLEEEDIPMPSKEDVSFSMDSETFRDLSPEERQIWVIRQLKRDILGRAVDESGTPVLATDMAEDFLDESFSFDATTNQHIEAEETFQSQTVLPQDPGAVKEEKGFREGVLDEFTGSEAPVQLQGVYGIDLATGELKPGYLRYADNPANRRIGRAGKVYLRGLRLHSSRVMKQEPEG